MPGTADIRPADWDTEQEILRSIREQVFVQGMDIDPDLEWDGQDAGAHHVLAWVDDGEQRTAVGTARLLADGQIGRVAVLESWRNQGIGRDLMLSLIELARQRQLSRVFLHAQQQTVDFYQALGFTPYGDRFEEAGIPHQAMALLLEIPFVADPDAAGRTIVNPASGPVSSSTFDTEMRPFSNETVARDVLHALTGTALRYLDLFSPQLDHQLFDDPTWLALLSDLVRRHRHAQVRVLICDNSAVLSRGHGLVRLMQRLPGSISLRLLTDERLLDTKQSFVIVDTRGYWRQLDLDAYVGAGCLQDPVSARRLQDIFDHAYELGREDPETRVLHL